MNRKQMKKIGLNFLIIIAITFLIYLLAVAIGLNDWDFLTFRNIVKISSLDFLVAILFQLASIDNINLSKIKDS